MGHQFAQLYGQSSIKIVARQLFQYCKKYSKLYVGQIGGRKKSLIIDVVAIFVHTVQENCEETKQATLLFMDL